MAQLTKFLVNIIKPILLKAKAIIFQLNISTGKNFSAVEVRQKSSIAAKTKTKDLVLKVSISKRQKLSISSKT